MTTQTAEAFTPTHHALMVAWISEALVDAVGEEEGERIFRSGVVKYGNQRGRRMAMRAEANGHPLSMTNYFAYAEVMLKRSDLEMKLLERAPHVRWRASTCPWIVAWEKNDLARVRYIR